jgi:hypothetical protein
LILFLLLAKIKGEEELTLLGAPSEVKKNSEPSSVKIFFSHEVAFQLYTKNTNLVLSN